MYTEKITLDVSSASQVDELESVQKKQKMLNQILIQHILDSMHTQASFIEKSTKQKASSSSMQSYASICQESNVNEENVNSSALLEVSTSSSLSVGSSSGAGSASSSSSSSSKSQGAPGVYGAYGQPITSQPQIGNITLTGDYKHDLALLQSLFSNQMGNFNDPRRTIDILSFMIAFKKRYASEPSAATIINSEQWKKTEQMMAQTYIAAAYTGCLKDTTFDQALAKVQALYSGAGPDYTQKEFYVNNPKYNENGKPIPAWCFLIRGISDLAATCQKSIKILNKLITTEQLREIMKDAQEYKMKGHLNVHLIYLQLMEIIREKEGDSQDEIAGTANMLKELGYGEQDIGNVTDAFSAIISGTNMISGDTNTDLQNFYNAFKKVTHYDGTPDSLKNVIAMLQNDPNIKLSPTAADALSKIITVLTKQGDKIDFLNLSDSDKNIISSNLTTLKNDSSAKRLEISLNWAEKGTISFAKMTDDVNTFSPEAAQRLAQALLEIKELGDSSLFPDLKDIVSQLLGDNGDLKNLAGIDTALLTKAASGDIAAEKEIITKLRALIPSQPDDNTNKISTLNTAFNKIASYFNDHNASEQSMSQYLSGNEEKILAFIKEGQDQPVKFEEAIMANLQRSGQ